MKDADSHHLTWFCEARSPAPAPAPAPRVRLPLKVHSPKVVRKGQSLRVGEGGHLWQRSVA